ncbi:MAG TPA: LuxR C-terminal-related transcriptional regulator [Candidatus Limnocylindria bacterium]|nr:LuxR C-terminal-related transcriptional regulator [Candidatus Limnocylindria bacterium]
MAAALSGTARRPLIPVGSAPERRREQPGRRHADLWLQLTPRQRLVLDRVTAGSSNKEIATQLGVSEQAAKQQVSKLLTRFGVESRTALAQSALAIRITGQRESDLPLEYLFDLAPVAMAMTSGPEHVFRAVNRTFTQLFGDRDGWIGYRLRDLLMEAEPALLPLVDAAYQAGTGTQQGGVPVKWTGRDGATERSLMITVEPTRRAAGAVSGLVFFGVDVTEEIDLRVRLQTAQAQEQAIVQRLPGRIAVIVVDRAGLPVTTTGPLTEILGEPLQPDVVLAAQAPRYALRWADTGLPLSAANSPSVRALAGEDVTAELVGRVHRDGPAIKLRVSARPMRGANDEIVSAVLVLEELPAD